MNNIKQKTQKRQDENSRLLHCGCTSFFFLSLRHCQRLDQKAIILKEAWVHLQKCGEEVHDVVS